jgi:hypothetical protein
MAYQVKFPDGLDDFDWADIEAKGWLEGVRVVLDERAYDVAVFDEVRLRQAIAVDLERLGYFVASRLLVVAAVTREQVELAIARMAERGFSDL